MSLLLLAPIAGCGRSELDLPDDDVPPSGDVFDVPDARDAPDVPDARDVPDVPDVPFCRSTSDCDDGVACTVDRCVEGVRCESVPDDSLCGPRSMCVPSRGCSEPVECTSDAMCDDGDPCDGAERCAAGRCARGAPLACNDGVACTDDVCVPGRGCVAVGVDARCDDGRFCTGAERCDLRAGCVRGAPTTCDDGVACTDDLCDERTRSCRNTPADRDGDGFAAVACAGGDCDDADRAVNPRAVEACGDGRDNNCNGLTDCADPACAATPACTTVLNDVCERATLLTLPGRAEGTTAVARDDYSPGCGSNTAPDVAYVIRNPRRQTLVFDTIGSAYDTVLGVYRDRCDLTTLITCDDDGSHTGTASRIVLDNAEAGTYYIVVDGWSASSGAFVLNVSAGAPPVEQCTNRIDDDGDGFVDCADSNCNADPTCRCRPTGLENNTAACSDGRDNDCDGLVDCGDAQCAALLLCCRPTGLENTPAACADRLDNDCNGLVDCADAACAATAACCRPTGLEGALAACSDGRDNDCDGLVDCADPQCAAVSICCRPTGAETTAAACADGRDNDCNGLIDCADFQCAGRAGCGCVPSAEVCDNRRDDDCDGLTDCADPQCAMDPACVVCVPSGVESSPAACTDGRDNDCNGLADCRDPLCATVQGCAPVPPNDTCAGAERIAAPSMTTATTVGAIDHYRPVADGAGCRGGEGGEVVYALFVSRPAQVTVSTAGSEFDTLLYVRSGACVTGAQVACNDDDGGLTSRVTFDAAPGVYYVFVDGFGPDSRGAFQLAVSVAAREVCANRVDDDGDGLTDCADPDCAADVACRCVPTGAETTSAACSDARDNDCDGLTDCADPQCASAAACCRATSAREFGVAACTNGRDDDCDGVADCDDSDCRPSRDATAECCNGRDDNGNALIDEFACACETTAQCSGVGNGGPFPSTACWASTFRVCAPRCDLLGGDTFCSMYFAGTRCNRATGECAR